MKSLVLSAFALGVAHGWWLVKDEVCYEDFGIGCFDREEPFTNSLLYLPWRPEELGVDFLLYTRDNPGESQALLYRDRASIKASNYRASRPTRVITHGWDGSAPNYWSSVMRDEILKKEDANVILVDWEEGAAASMYRQAVANTRAVGAMIGEQIKFINAATGSRPGQFHLIGYSLGAHVCGYAGAWVPGIGRITGLDPAGPAFTGYDNDVKLDSSDADYVDVIHTDMDFLGFGTDDVLGHADFYPNGGEIQPGCPLIKRRETLMSMIACSHDRAPAYFIASINSCSFSASPCPDHQEFLAGNCSSTCPPEGCPLMGWGADQVPRAQGTLYLNTTDTPPFC